MYIVVVQDERGALISEHALFEGQLTLGRTADNDIVLPSNTVSRHHATLFMEGLTAYEGTVVRVGEYHVYLERATGKLRPSQAGINTAIVTPDQAHAKLVVVAGPQAGREMLLFDPIVCIGRTD